jgi:hypothetical protein
MEPEAHYRVHNSQQSVFSLGQINPVTAVHPISVRSTLMFPSIYTYE